MKRKKESNMNDLEIIEFLDVLNGTGNLECLECGVDDLLNYHTVSDSFLGYILDNSVNERLNKKIEEVNNWVDDRFNNENDPNDDYAKQFKQEGVLDYDDYINQLIICRGLATEVTVKDMRLKNGELTIKFQDREDLVSLWDDSSIPEQLIDNWLDVSKSNLIAEIMSTTDNKIIRKLTITIKKLKEKKVNNMKN